MSKQCSRLWEVEAVRDGRLFDTERARVERHVALCPDCAREAESLAKLHRALRNLPSTKPDELAVRRRRQTLLMAANAASHATPRNSARLAGIVSIAAVIALAAIGLRARHMDQPHDKPIDSGRVSSREEPTLDVRGDDGAVFLRATEGDRERVVLSNGRVSFTVRLREGGRKLLVQTPDAEIEDIGTEFSVLVENGKTAEVNVIEGRVVVRLRGAPPEVVEAGSTWRPPPRTEASAFVSPVVQQPPPVTSGSVASKPPPITRLPQAFSTTPPTAPEEAPPSIEPAMAAYHAGDYGRAATLFGQFEHDHPSDARAEDAAYLRVLALLRAGRGEEARAAAREYLIKHPGGFRAREAEQIAKP